MARDSLVKGTVLESLGPWAKVPDGVYGLTRPILLGSGKSEKSPLL